MNPIHCYVFFKQHLQNPAEWELIVAKDNMILKWINCGYKVNLVRQYYCYNIALKRLLLEGFPILKKDVHKSEGDQRRIIQMI